MSKCVACDELLSNREAARKSINTGDEIGLCDSCFEGSDIPRAVVEENPLLDNTIEQELIDTLTLGD